MKTYSSHENTATLQIKKLRAHDGSFVYIPILYYLKQLRKKFISTKHETTLRYNFFQKFALFLKAISMPLFMRFIHDTEPFKFAYSCAEECVAMTSECFSRDVFFRSS